MARRPACVLVAVALSALAAKDHPPTPKERADLIRRALDHIGDAAGLAAIGNEVRDLCARFPIYPGRRGTA